MRLPRILTPIAVTFHRLRLLLLAGLQFLTEVAGFVLGCIELGFVQLLLNATKLFILFEFECLVRVAGVLAAVPFKHFEVVFIEVLFERQVLFLKADDKFLSVAPALS